MRHHDLKLHVQFFPDVVTGRKRFELRTNDRDFQVGDTFTMYAWDPVANDYAGPAVDGSILFVIEDERWLVKGVCAWSFNVKMIHKRKYPGRSFAP